MLIARFITPTAPALTFLYYEHLRTAQEQDWTLYVNTLLCLK
jgi:hypothetical protein